MKGSLFFVTSGGKPLSLMELSVNLKEIVNRLKVGDPVATASETASASLATSLSKDENRAELKEKLLAKLNRGTKRKCPFPGDNIVNKRVRHICLSPNGSSLVTYMGKVVRVSNANDIEELMEEEYRSYYDKGYTFYTVVYDPPYNQLFTYPLKKEWDDDLLSLV